MMSERDVRRMAMIARRTYSASLKAGLFEQAGQVSRRERPTRAPLTAPRRTERRGTPAWSSRSLAERRPLRRLHCKRENW